MLKITSIHCITISDVYEETLSNKIREILLTDNFVVTKSVVLSILINV
jgi:hypothetical protein